LPEPRKAVQRMAPYTPPTGSRVEKLRLDFNENTVGCSPRVIAALEARLSASQLAMYPEYAAVMQDLAAFFQVSPEEFTMTNGTDEAIQLFVNTFVEAASDVLVLTPSYPLYRFYLELADASIRQVDYRAEFEFPLEELIAAVRPETRAVFISNPNNPTGAGIGLTDVKRILDAAQNCAVLVDEAYFEFAGVSALGWIREYPNLFVSRTFSKVYGMAGMRCGCLFSNAENVRWLRKAQSPFSVNVLALIAARAAVQDREYVANYVGEILAAREMACAGLRKLGIRYFTSHSNFVLFDVGDRALPIRDALRARGVLVRDRSYEIPGCVRLTIGTRDQIERFLSEMERLWTR
jgi:histidinol-phosphate aminotransferase